MSRRFNGDADAGTAVWTAKAQTGVTIRSGLFTGPEFTRSSDQYQSSEVQWMTEEGYGCGFSRQYAGTAEAGAGVWVVNANTGVTHRVGFYSAPEYTRAVDGIQESSLYWITSAGQAIGTSTKFTGDPATSWVADANTGVTIRVGLPIPGEGENFDYTHAVHLTKSGFVGGEASRDGGSRAAWVMRISTQESFRVGLMEPGVFMAEDGASQSSLEILKESGRSGGYSLFYGGGSAGQAAWVTDGFPGVARRVGLHSDPAFTGLNGLQMSSVKLLTESGISAGTSAIYIRNRDAGQAAWVCHPATGISTRVGLFTASEFQPNNFGANMVVEKLTESGLVFGTSTRRYQINDEAPWIASAVTGVTTALGLSDAVHTALDLHRSGVTDTRFLVRGYVIGNSDRYQKTAEKKGATAWLYDAGTGLQTNFELSVRTSDGYAWSKILGISPEGIAYGTYERFNGEVFMERRAFVWSRDWGTVDLADEVGGGIGQFGWRKFEFLHSALGNGLFLGSGETTSGESGIFVVQAGGELPGLTHRQGWERQYFSPGAEPEDSHDTDGDGIPDGLEYAWGFSPLAANAMERGLAVLPGPDAGEPMALTFRRNPLATDIRYTLEASSDFITWTPLAESSDGQTAAGTGFLREEQIPGEPPFLTVFVRDPAAPDPAGKRFARLRVTR